MIFQLFYIFVGFFIGIIGTIIGAGGGFIAVPMLLWIYPNFNSSYASRVITSCSQLFIFFNALLGSIEHAKVRIIKYKQGLLYSAGAIPALIIGIYINDKISLGWFKIIFGAIIIPISAFSFIRSYHEISTRENPNNILGMIISFFISIFASTLGVGGGILYGPTFAYFLKFDKLIAKATSMFIVGITSFVIILVRTKQNVLPFELAGYLLLVLIFIAVGIIAGYFIEKLLSRQLSCECKLNKKQVCGTCLPKYLFSGIFSVLVSYTLFLLSNIAKSEAFINGEYGKIFLITLLFTAGGSHSSRLGNALSIKFGGSWVMRILAMALGIVGILTIYRGWSGLTGQ
ncbi:MAG: sulfite exporter TauE/SafE family protein [Candidatus Poribacteria bacterium]